MRTSGENLNSMYTHTHAVQPTHVMFATSRSNMRRGMGSNAFQPTNNIMHVFVNEVIDDVEVLEVGYTHLQSMQEAVHDGLCGLYGYRRINPLDVLDTNASLLELVYRTLLITVK